MSMHTFGPKLDYLVCILMFAYILHANDELYACKLHSDFCKGMQLAVAISDAPIIGNIRNWFISDVFTMSLISETLILLVTGKP